MSGLRILFFACSGTAAPHVMAGFRSALERKGHLVQTLDISGATAAEHINVISAIRDFEPHCAVLYAVPRGAQLYDASGIFFLDALEIPYVCLWYDNPFLYLQELTPAQREMLRRSPRCLMCCSDLTYVGDMHNAGFSRVEYLPLATDPALFCPESLTAAQQADWSADVSFVGSIDENPEALRQQRQKRWEKFPVLNKTIDEMTDITDGQTSLDMANKINRLQEHLPWDVYAVFCRTVYEEAATFLRLYTINALPDCRVAVYGGSGWRRLGARLLYRGRIDYGESLRLVYTATKINLNITNPQLRTAVTQRLFDVSACGAFVLSDYRQDVRHLFGDTVVTYEDSADLRKKVAYFLTHDAERAAYAQQARERVLAQHTYEHRAQTLLEAMFSALHLREPIAAIDRRSG